MRSKHVVLITLLTALIFGILIAAAWAQTGGAITAFTSSAASITEAELASGNARIPIVWETINRPENSNLVFEQVLAGGNVVNIELPREVRRLPDSGEGVIAPSLPNGNVSEIVIQARLIDLSTNLAIDQKQLTIRIGPPQPAIRSFASVFSAVFRDDLENGEAQIPVMWEVVDRPESANLAFEQVLPDGTVLNIELPRADPLVPSSGRGLVGPIPPDGGVMELTLQLRLFGIENGQIFDQKRVVVPISNEPVGQIGLFTGDVAVNRARLEIGVARVAVQWEVIQRPDGSNLIFEQLLPGGTAINVELPRDNVIIPSVGRGFVEPQLPEGGAGEVVLQARLIDLSTGRVYDRAEWRVIVPDTAPPTITTFTTTATEVSPSALRNSTARVPVIWRVDNRPEDTNLVFEQVLADGTFVNVELPRPAELVPSQGEGVVAPVFPGETTNQIVLQLRLFDRPTGRVYAEEQFALPILEPPPPQPQIVTLMTTVASLDREALADGSARLPLTWEVENRPENSNLVFEQLMPDNTVVGIELARDFVLIPSSGQGLVAPVLPRGGATGVITVRARLVDLESGEVLAERELLVDMTPVAAGGTGTGPTGSATSP